MHLFVNGRFEQGTNLGSGQKLCAAAAAFLALAFCAFPALAQQAAEQTAPAAETAPPPAPIPTEPLFLRSSAVNYAKPNGDLLGNPLKLYSGVQAPKARFYDAVRLGDMVKDGKIYLSLSDALALALENNYDIGIARYNLDIADTDILRSKTGSSILGVSATLLTGTLGSASSTLTSGGGPGGTTLSSGSSGTGGLSLTTNGAGPTPESLDPVLSSTIQFERANTLKTSATSYYNNTNTNSYDFAYSQGFTPGTSLSVTWNNSRVTSSYPYYIYSPELNSSFKATVTQHLLQGAGFWVNKRFMYQAVNNRRYTDSAFRLQILYTVNQVENIYWALVAAYEDVQAKEQALAQSTKLAADNRKQLEVGAMAPIDVVNSDSAVAADKQALINSQSALTYQQLVLKQAIARNLGDATLAAAPVVPTDRVTLDPLPEESQSADELAQEAFKNRPELEQATLTLKNDEITLRGAKNALLPTLDVYGFYGGSGVAGAQNAACTSVYCSTPVATTGFGTALSGAFNSAAPDKGVGFNLSIPLRNREAQSVQARSQLEYRQAQLHLEQLYTQVRMQVINAQYALTNDRALVQSAAAAEQYNRQSLESEQTKLKLGASTTANVLLQQRNLATATYNLITSRAAYARDRANLYQTLATTLQHYGVNLTDVATGEVKAAPAVPGLTAVKAVSK
jgi:outer membrane protein